MAHYANSSDKHKMWHAAQSRAKKKGIPFTITVDDIVVPTVCPVLGVPLVRGTGKPPPSPNAPSLDRIVASKGYVPGNVIVISFRANRIKTDASLDELKRVAAWLETVLISKE